MKLIIALFILAAGTANAQGYRTISLGGVVFTGYSELSGNVGRQNCEANANNLASLISYFSDDGLSLTYQGDCISGKHYDETILTSTVRTNLPSGTYSLRPVCVGNVDRIRRLYALLSNRDLQIILAKDDIKKCNDKDYPHSFILKVIIN